jgi:hypothetical protein
MFRAGFWLANGCFVTFLSYERASVFGTGGGVGVESTVGADGGFGRTTLAILVFRASAALSTVLASGAATGTAAAAAASASRSFFDLPAPSSAASLAFNLSCFAIASCSSSSLRRLMASSRFSRITFSCIFTASSIEINGSAGASFCDGICLAQAEF